MSEVRDVTTWYLEMRAVSQLVPSRQSSIPHRVERVERPSAEFSRYLYTAVGGPYRWTDRLAWTKARWARHLARQQVTLYTVQVGGAPAGYVELEQQPRGDVQLVYFGILSEYFGRGLGGAFLTRAIQLAWQQPAAARVWVHTCTLDSPAALANYRARGFIVFHQKTRAVELSPTPEPWPGWDDEDSSSQ
jgi:ribosomal protein S18 acetylase RimI-like enzyme